MKNAIEIFTMLYNDEISEEECIEVVHPEESGHYLLRNRFGEFDRDELIRNLLFKEYNFKIVNQKEIEAMLAEQQKQNRISQLEAELKRLKGIE